MISRGRGAGCLLDRILIKKCWNENIGGRNALDLLYLRTSVYVGNLHFSPQALSSRDFTSHLGIYD